MSYSTGTVEAVQARLLARIPRSLHPLLSPTPGAVLIEATSIMDPDWLRAQLMLRARVWDTADEHVLATLWWYSASHYLVTPTVATLLVTGRAVSPALPDLVLHHYPDGSVSGAHSTALLPRDLAAVALALRATLTSVIEAVSAFTKRGVPPLWALATDGLAERLLFFGETLGRAHEAHLLAERLSSGIGAPLLPPRYVWVTDQSGRARQFLRRSSCCLLYRVSGQELCLSCPRRTPSERLQLLAREAASV